MQNVAERCEHWEREARARLGVNLRVRASAAAFRYYELLAGVRVRALSAVAFGAAAVALLSALWALFWWPVSSVSPTATATSTATCRSRRSSLLVLRLCCRILLSSALCLATPLLTVGLFIPARLALNWFTLLPALAASAIAAQRALIARSVLSTAVSLSHNVYHVHGCKYYCFIYVLLVFIRYIL